ncbi:MAG: hypothetical protein ACOC7V_13270 [Spirochaetota bacterium]
MALALLLGAGLPAADTLAAQEIPATAILEVGPERRRGIDALAPDVTPHWHARYRVAAAEVELFYAPSPLSEPAGWPPAPCRQRALRAADEPDGGASAAGLTYYEDAAGWSLLVRLADGELPPGITLCDFVDGFIDRHLFFERAEQRTIPDKAPAFPAVIEL